MYNGTRASDDSLDREFQKLSNVERKDGLIGKGK